MDPNKLIELRRIGYRVGKTCGTCKHGVFPNDEWGTCGLHSYDHQKHMSKRHLSIVRSGSCDRFEADEARLETLGAYREFVR